MSRRGRTSAKSSATRSATLKAHAAAYKRQRTGVPRQSLTVGLVRRPPPDPTLRPLPRDVFLVPCCRQADVKPQTICGRILDVWCADCSARLAVDSCRVAKATDHEHRQGRPLVFICTDCCRRYVTQATAVEPARTRNAKPDP